MSFADVECGRVELVTTDLFSKNKQDFVLIGTPKHLKVCLKSIMCSVAVLDAANSDPYVAASTVSCLFEYESIGYDSQNVNNQFQIYQWISSNSNLHPL